MFRHIHDRQLGSLSLISQKREEHKDSRKGTIKDIVFVVGTMACFIILGSIFALLRTIV